MLWLTMALVATMVISLAIAVLQPITIVLGMCWVFWISAVLYAEITDPYLHA